MVSSGSTFSVGIDKDGNVYEWGTFPTEKLKSIPSSSEMGKLTQISAGLDHVLGSLALGICTISINCVGDGLRDAIDPKSKER